MKKRILSGLMALLMLGSSFCLVGCEKDQTAGGDTDTLTYWCKMDAGVATHAQTYNEMEMYKKMEEITGVHIDFTHPPIGQEGEQFKLLFASKEKPDLIEYSWSAYTGGPQKAIDEGMILDISEYLDYAPNFKKALYADTELAEEYRRATIMPSGAIYGFPTFNVGEYRTFCGITIRKDWLDELGLDVPETIDEWTTVLRAFKEKKGAKAPLTGELSGLLNYNIFVGAFGIGQRFYVDGDDVKYGPMEDGYKEYVKVLNQWYEEGLIDNDIATNKSTLIDSKILNGESGALLYTPIGGGIGKYMGQQKEGSKFELVAAPFPVLKKGDMNEYTIVDGDVNTSGTVAISASCKDPIAAVKWMDQWYSEEGYYLMNFGVEGISYNMVDGKPVYTDLILDNPDGLSISEALRMNCRASIPAPGFQQAPEYLEQFYEYDQQMEALEMWSKNVPGSKKHKMPTVWKSAEDENRISEIATDLDTYLQEKLTGFITGKESIDKYDKFREELKKSFHVDEYIEIQQKYVDDQNK